MCEGERAGIGLNHGCVRGKNSGNGSSGCRRGKKERGLGVHEGKKGGKREPGVQERKKRRK